MLLLLAVVGCVLALLVLVVGCCLPLVMVYVCEVAGCRCVSLVVECWCRWYVWLLFVVPGVVGIVGCCRCVIFFVWLCAVVGC